MTFGHVYKVEAIVLSRRNTGEADRILTIFTKEYGKIRVLAKGIRRVTSRRAPHAEVFSRVVLMLHRGKANLDLVSEITPLETYEILRQDLKRVSLGYYLCELIDRLLPERQEHRDVYLLLSNAFAQLNDKNLNNLDYLSEQFAVELLHCLGFLARDKRLDPHEITPYIESIIEKRLRTPKIIHQLKVL